MAHRRRLSPIVVDKHLDHAALSAILGRRGVSAALIRPTLAYRGQYAKDEDFAEVLQLGFEYRAAVLSADNDMLRKALQFEKQLPKEESCLRGLILLPHVKELQMSSLEKFVRGHTVITATRKGDFVPTDIDGLEDYNIAIDLREKNPRAIHLCKCREI
jgi:hypothetical protein